VLSLPPALLLLCIGGQFDANGLVTLEARAGEAPLNADGVVRAGVVAVLTPDLQLSYLSRTTDLRLDYSPRIFWREPNDLNTHRPLILHVANFVAVSQASRTLRLTGSANASIGESDYTALAQLLGPTQAAIPSVVDFLSVTSSAGAVANLSRRATFGAALTFTHRRPLGAAATVVLPDPSMTPFPRQTSFTASPSLRVNLSRADDLILTSPVSYGTYSTGVDILTVSPQVGWLTHLSPLYDLRAALGIAYARVVPALTTSSPVAPVGELGLDMRLSNQGGVATRASTGVRVDYFVDPVLGTAGPRALVLLGLSSTLNPDWLVGIDASYSTVFVGTSPGPMGYQPDETAVSVSIPVRFRASDNLLTEFGFRYSDRAPSVQVSAFGFHQRQLWLYGLFTATTRRPTSRRVQ